MQRRTVSGITLTLLLIGMLTLTFCIQTVKAEPRTITVPDDYPTIQEAVNAANDGDTVFVRIGTYYEHVVVNKTVSLVGEDVSAAIVDGDDTGHVVEVVSNNVNITGFTLQNSGNIHWPDLNAGICLNGTTNCTISENRLVGNGFAGISLIDSEGSAITDNNVTGTSWGGVHLANSSNNTVSGNILDSNIYTGINGHASSHYNDIVDNVISNSTYGMFFHNAKHNNICRNNISNIAVEGIWFQDQVDYNVVAENNLTNNTVAIRLQGPNYYNNLSRNVITGAQYGIRIQYSANFNAIFQNNMSQNDCGFYIEYSTQNSIWHNNFVDNDQQVYASAGSINSWDHGHPSGGNYWSDHVSVDNYSGINQDEPGSDGIVDEPYEIDESNQDNYPLMEPWTPPPPIPTTIEEMKTKMEDLAAEGEIDNRGIVKSLIAKLNVAQKLVDKGKVDEAKGILEDGFIRQAQNLSGICITAEAADILIQSAEYIIYHL